jgi:hypothetical protein
LPYWRQSREKARILPQSKTLATGAGTVLRSSNLATSAGTLFLRMNPGPFGSLAPSFRKLWRI